MLFTAAYPKSLDDEAFGYLKRVIVTPAVYPRVFEFHHFDIQSTGQKSRCAKLTLIHISEPTRHSLISYAVFSLK